MGLVSSLKPPRRKKHDRGEITSNPCFLPNLYRKTPMRSRQIDGMNEEQFDKLTLVLGLRKHGWSFRKIGRIIRTPTNTVISLYKKALRYRHSGKLNKNANNERVCQILYVGGTNELEEIEKGLIDRQHGKKYGTAHSDY